MECRRCFVPTQVSRLSFQGVRDTMRGYRLLWGDLRRILHSPDQAGNPVKDNLVR